ncbi:MAG: LuxR C-terminal-related transcriptional regulator, partial [Chloroflexota bacterium]
MSSRVMGSTMGLESLKQRELDILRLMAEGLTDAEIAVALHLATGTVRWYNKNLYQKLDVHSRTEAVQYAQSHGLLEATYATDVPSEIPKSPIQYVKSDGLHIAFQVVGDGDIDILFLPGFVSHIEGFWENPEVAQYFERLGTQHRLIMFDRRGMGLSDRTHRPMPRRSNIIRRCCVPSRSKYCATSGFSQNP